MLRLDEGRYPEKYQRLLRRLNRAVEQDEVRKRMDIEDRYVLEPEHLISATLAISGVIGYDAILPGRCAHLRACLILHVAVSSLEETHARSTHHTFCRFLFALEPRPGAWCSASHRLRLQ